MFISKDATIMAGETHKRTCWFLRTPWVNTNISQSIFFSGSLESWHFFPNPLNVKYKLIWKSIFRFTIGFLIWSNTIKKFNRLTKETEKNNGGGIVCGFWNNDTKIAFSACNLIQNIFFRVVTPEEIQIFLHNICLLLKRESH